MIHFDTSSLPVVHVQISDTVLDHELEAALCRCTRTLSKSASFVAVIHTPPSFWLTPNQRLMSGRWFQQNVAGLQVACMGLIFVAPSASVRHIVATIAGPFTSVVPAYVAQTERDAMDLAERAMANVRDTGALIAVPSRQRTPSGFSL